MIRFLMHDIAFTLLRLWLQRATDRLDPDVDAQDADVTWTPLMLLEWHAVSRSSLWLDPRAFWVLECY